MAPEIAEAPPTAHLVYVGLPTVEDSIARVALPAVTAALTPLT